MPGFTLTINGTKGSKITRIHSQNLVSGSCLFPFCWQGRPTYFSFFSLSFLSLLALFYPFSGSSLQLCYLRVIHPLFSLLSKSLHASWAASIKEVVAAQQSLGRAEQRHWDYMDAACSDLGPAPRHPAWEQGWKGQLLPRDQPGFSLHLSKVHNYSENKIFWIYTIALLLFFSWFIPL